jgi:hypothetical protein
MKPISYELLAKLDDTARKLSWEDQREAALVFLTAGVVTMRRLGLSDEVILERIKNTMGAVPRV